jgi:hydrophobic/amphiphilic exporter-1 (mainly G- bacteria), HAE1 family
MRSWVSWAVQNTPGINVMVLAVIVSGIAGFAMLRRETFPEFELEYVLVTIPYPGASPADTEKGVCQPVEEAIRSLSGVKRLRSIAREGGGYVIAELNANVRDVQKIVNEVRSRVERISNFPELAENAQVEQLTFRQPAIRLAVIGPNSTDPDAEMRLREVTEMVRDRVLELPEVTQANLLGAKPFQIDVELSEDTLRKYGLTLSRVAQILRRENVEMPGGQLKADGQEILLRGKNRREIGEDIKKLPVIRQANGVVLNIEDIGHVRDEFDDLTTVNEVNGQPAMVVSIDRTSEEDLIRIADAVNRFADPSNPKGLKLPAGYTLRTWGDTSVDVRDRMRLLRDNGVQGLLLVFILLTLFLELRLAFWVSLGIPISVLGAGVVLYLTGQTLNMLSMFAFLMALGIVVDDAIVIGENIYTHRQLGKGPVQAAIDGAVEVLPSVMSSVATTIIAFLPMFFVSGVMGKFIAVMPAAIIAMLVISLVESTFALPCHLSHTTAEKPRNLWEWMTAVIAKPFQPVVRGIHWMSARAEGGLDWVGDRLYQPAFDFLLRYPLVGVSGAIMVLLVTIGAVRSGVVPFDPFPKTDGNQIIAQVIYPDGTPAYMADESTQRLEDAIRLVSEQVYEQDLLRKGAEAVSATAADPLAPKGPIKLIFRQVGRASAQGALGSAQSSNGSHVGQVEVELHDASERSLTSTELINLWRQAAGDFPGAERVTFDSASVGPGGNPIEFKLLANAEYQDQLDAAVADAKLALATFQGVYDIRDDVSEGKLEFQIKIKDRAIATGVTTADLAETIRNSYYGAEVMRLQRGRHEVKLMVRYPKDERRSLADFKEIRVRGDDGVERPITELAEITVTRGYSEINRLDQQRSITVLANLDPAETNTTDVINGLRADFVSKLAENYPAVGISWEGQQQQTRESLQSLFVGTALALLAMYVLLVLEFRSYLQPLLILAIIPFGAIGAIWGHRFMGLPMTLFSFFGLVALTGVVVNDSIVLIDFMNARVRGGVPIEQALREAGRRRLRPVFLTSLTTIGGLSPMLLERSFQAQFLVPMATSLAFGLMLSTVLVLFQIPIFYKLYLMLVMAFGFDPTQVGAHDEAPVAPGVRIPESTATTPGLAHALPQPSLDAHRT